MQKMGWFGVVRGHLRALTRKSQILTPPSAFGTPAGVDPGRISRGSCRPSADSQAVDHCVGCATGTHVPVAQTTIKPAYRSNSLEGKPFSRHFPFLQFVSKQTNVLVTNKTFLSSTHSVRHRSGRVSHVPVATRTRMQRSTSCQIRCHNQDRLFLNV